MASILAGFSIVRNGTDYIIKIEDEEGVSTEYEASFEQLDLITESIDEVLNQDEEDILGANADNELDIPAED
jgi:hypothetical protein